MKWFGAAVLAVAVCACAMQPQVRLPPQLVESNVPFASSAGLEFGMGLFAAESRDCDEPDACESAVKRALRELCEAVSVEAEVEVACADEAAYAMFAALLVISMESQTDIANIAPRAWAVVKRLADE